jgi:hypothetical protein
MYEFLFRNKWVALAAAVLLLAGISALVGREGDDGLLARTQRDLAARHHEAPDEAGEIARSQSEAYTPPPPAETSQEFVDDEELVDNADGYDPSPPDDQQADDAGSSGDDEDQGDIVPGDDAGE